MGILLGLGDAQLAKAQRRNVLADRIGHIILVEEYMQPRELGVVGGHAAVVKRQGAHTLLGHILLREHDRKLLGTVVTVVEEYYHIALPDRSHGLTLGIDMHDRLDELVGHAGIVRALHSLDHVGRSLALALDQKVVGDLDALPAPVAVHGIVTSYDRGDTAGRRGHVALQRLDEALAAARIGIATVHEAVYEGVVDTVVRRYVAQLEQMIERRVYAAVRHQSHEVHFRAFGLGILERTDDLAVFEYRVVAAGTIDLYQILIDDTAGTYVKMSHLGVAHLPLGQSDVLAVGQQSCMRPRRGHLLDVGRMRRIDCVGAAVIAVAPTVQYHQ